MRKGVERIIGHISFEISHLSFAVARGIWHSWEYDMRTEMCTS